MIIIPTYNERGNIVRLVEEIRKAAGSVPIMFVDDNSPDGTQQEITALQENDQNIHLLKRSKKMGLGPAYREAFSLILQNGQAEYVITMDADLSHDPAELPRIIELVKRNAVVVGSRYVPGGKILNWNLLRRLISWFGNVYAKWLTGAPVSDLTSGYVAYQTDWLKRAPLQGLQTDGYAFQIEMKYVLGAMGANIHEHPIAFIDRGGGKSKFSSAIVLEGIRYPLKIWFVRALNIFK